MKQYDWDKIQEFYDQGKTWQDVSQKFGVAKATLYKAKKRGDFVSRNKSEAMKLSCKQNPRKLSQKTKDKISKARKKYLKENPDKVPYLLNHYSKGDSYPEKYFNECLLNSSFVKKYRVGNYELDFADVENKINLEIDGEQHFVDQRIVKHDKKRNQFLSELGWKIIRIRWSLFQQQTKSIKEKIIKSIVDNEPLDDDCIYVFSANVNPDKLDFFKKQQKRKNSQTKLDKNGNPNSICICGEPKCKSAKLCLKCHGKNQPTKIQWPKPKDLQKLLWNKPTSKIAKDLGVSDKSIEKFCKKHGLSKPPRGYWQKNGEA